MKKTNFNIEDGNLYYGTKTKTNENEKIFSRTVFGTKYIEIIDSTIS